MSAKNQGSRANPDQSAAAVLQSVLKGLVAILVVVGLAILFTTTNNRYRAQAIDPKFEMIDFKDGSLSFSTSQLQEELGTHDAVYAACFGGEPVQYVCYGFGGNVVEIGAAVTTAPLQTWPILDRDGPVDALSSRFAPAIKQVYKLATTHANRVVGVVFQSDGEATDWKELDVAVRELATLKNVAFVAISGAIPSSRIRLRKAMEPLGDRFVACDVTDTNQATASKLAALVARARSVR